MPRHRVAPSAPDQCYGGAFLCQCSRYRRPYAGAAAGDQCVQPTSAPITPSPSSRQGATSIDAADRGPPNKVSASQALVTKVCRGVQSPVRVARCGRARQTRSRPPCHQDRIDVVGVVDVSDRERRIPASLRIRRRTASETSVRRRPCPFRSLSGGYIDHVGAGVGQYAATSTASRGEMPSGTQSLAEMRTDIGLSSGHTARTARNTLKWKPHAVLETAAIFVGALVGERRDERRHQVAVRVMQLEPVKAGTLRHLRRADELVAHSVHVRACHRPRRLVLRPQAHRRGPITVQLPDGSGASIVSQPSWVEPLGPEWPSWMAKFSVAFGVDEIDDPLPRGFVLRAIKPRAKPGVIRPSGDTQSLSKDQPCPAFGALGNSEPDASRRGYRRPRGTAPSATPQPGFSIRCRARERYEHGGRGSAAPAPSPGDRTSAPRPPSQFHRARAVFMADPLRTRQQ